MKILMVNKFFYIKGGSETYYFALKRKLEKEGHIVIDFSMKDKKNFESKYIKQAERARKDNAQVQQQERTRKN